MATYGLGNFRYDVTVDGNSANYKFWDQEDVSNTAEVSLSSKDFPEGVTQPDTREVAEVAYAKVAGQLNSKRDERQAKEKADEAARQAKAEAESRAAANEYFASTEELADRPNYGEEKAAPAPVQEDKGNKKK